MIVPQLLGGAGQLKKRSVIKYSRGRIKTIDVQVLEDVSCECYLVLKGEYDRLLGIRSSSATGH